MKTYICSHVGSTEACAECEFCLPADSLASIQCEYQTKAKHVQLQFPVYFKDDNSYYVVKSAESAVKFTVYEQTFFASLVADKFQLANIFLNAQQIPAEMFDECVAFVQGILKEAGVNVTQTTIPVEHSDSFF
jgi:hypothetical protein